MSEYDEIIVGGGSAGIALATRLTEDAARRVLLVEAGPDQRGVVEGDRLGDTMKFSTTLTEWAIDATFLPGRSSNYPQGKKLGGGSAVNGGFAVRGVRDDYERWAAVAGEEWSWPHMLRVLCRLEADQDFTDESHGTNGPVPVVRWREDELLPVQQAFRDAVMEHGVPWVKDFNAPDTSGIGAIPMNRQDGVRMSTALTYLPLCRARDNLTIQGGTQVVRVVIEHGRATGVELLRNGQLEQVSAERVLLCAGALQSPTLLLRSGIGPAGPLADMGIDCVVELTGVGENLWSTREPSSSSYRETSWDRPTSAGASSEPATRHRRGLRPTTCGSPCGAHGRWPPFPSLRQPSACRAPARSSWACTTLRRGGPCVCAAAILTSHRRSTFACSANRPICCG